MTRSSSRADDRHDEAGAEPPFALRRHAPPAELAGAVLALTTYSERGTGSEMRETVPLRIPLIVSLGTPFAIAFGRDPAAPDRQPSFSAGLWPGPVHIRSDGGAECVQADLHPLAAFRLYGGATSALAGAMVPVEDLFGRAGRALVEACGNAPEAARAEILARFIADRLGPPPSATTRYAWDRLSRSGGRVRIDRIATDLGVSRTLLSSRVRAELGVAPKTLARMLRYGHACRLALAGAPWADVAATAGYADQAHLVREFAELAGEPPTQWARRVAAGPWLADAG